MSLGPIRVCVACAARFRTREDREFCMRCVAKEMWRHSCERALWQRRKLALGKFMSRRDLDELVAQAIAADPRPIAPVIELPIARERTS